jgi:hypothetical protein
VAAPVSDKTLRILIRALKPLAAKLGQGGAFAYRLAIHEVITSAVLNLIAGGLLLLFAVSSPFISAKLFSKGDELDRRSGFTDGTGYQMAGFFTAITGVAAVVGGGIELFSAIHNLLNPQYVALHNLIQTIR